jgi:hypothetical protein
VARTSRPRDSALSYSHGAFYVALGRVADAPRERMDGRIAGPIGCGSVQLKRSKVLAP